MHSNQDVLRSLPILAVALGRRHGIEVRIGGSRAAVTNKVMYLPSLPMDASEKLVTLAFGFMHHETGHLEFTELGLKREADSALHASFYGVVEDVRMEAERNRRYTGSASRLADLVGTLGKEGRFGDEEWIAQASNGDVVAFGALCRLRAGLLGQPLEEVAKLWEPRLNELLGKKGRIKFDALLADVQHLANSRDALGHARRLVTLMEDLAKDPPEDQPEDKPEQSPDQDQDQDQQQGQVDDQGQDPGESDEADADDDQANQGDGQDSDSKPGEGEADGEAGDSSNQDAGPDREAIKAMLDGTDGELSPSDIGDIASKELGEVAEEEVCSAVSSGADAVSSTLAVSRSSGGVSDFPAVAAASLALRTKLRAKMDSVARTKATRRDYGSRFDPMAAAAFIRGESKLFAHRDYHRKTNTAVEIVLDKSISMRGAAIGQARKAALAIAHGLEQLQGVATAAAAFPDIEVMKEFHEKAGSTAGRFSVVADGSSTPMAEAMVWACSSLAPRQEKRKILVVITDGAPNDRAAVSALLRRLKASRVECIGVGIGTDAVKGLFPVSCVIHDVSELSSALFGVIGTQLEKVA